MKFFVYSEFGEILDVALHLKYVEGNEVLWCVENADYHKIGQGLLPIAHHWWRRIGQGYIWIIDGTETGKMQDWLRSKGELVFGSSYLGAKLEEDRQLGQDVFKRMGLYVPFSQNFKDLDSCCQFASEWYAKKPGKKLILKQNGSAPKSVNYKGKFDGGEDFLYHLDELKKKWNEVEYGSFDCDIMEQVEGTELAVSAFWNGKNFLKGKDGKVVAFVNAEHKKQLNDDLGQTTGETGTLFWGVNTDNKLVKQLLENKELLKVLSKLEFRGVFDINGCVTKNGYVGFEFTMRPGIPSSSYEFLYGAGLNSRTDELIYTVAAGKDAVIDVYKGVGLVTVVYGAPFPVESDVEKESTSIGEKLWILKNNKPQKDFDKDQRLCIHLENFYKDGDDYKVATKNGYLLTVTTRGKTIKDARELSHQYIKDNIFIANMGYRTDLGAKYENLTLPTHQ